MATRAASKRLTREYGIITTNPPEYIIARPSESNILEWHYILTGPPDTPYANGQYWGSLVFPADYPFAPPAIRMHTPSGRFRCSERLCLSISDFHPKAWQPTWEVSTILLGVLSFMTSEEMTTGSISGTEAERKAFAAKSRWWNSTGGGSTSRKLKDMPVQSSNTRGFGAIKAGDGGKKFRELFPDLDEENWALMEKARIDPSTGMTMQHISPNSEASAPRAPARGQDSAGTRDTGSGFLTRNKWYLLAAGLFVYILVARVMGDHAT